MPPTYRFRVDDLIQSNRTNVSHIDAIKAWLKTAINLPTLTDQQIALFLLSCNNQQDATRHTIRAYFQCKNNAPELFDNWRVDADDVRNAWKIAETAVMPRRTRHNSAIIIGRLKDRNGWNFNLEQAVKVFFMSIELTLHDNPPAGLVVILDMKGFSLIHLTKLRLGVLKKLFQYLQEGLPCRLQAIHIFNVVYFIDRVLALLKPFMRKELIDMLVLHPPGMDMDEFFRIYVPAECMPDDYEGDLPEVAILASRTVDEFRRVEPFYVKEEVQRKIHRDP